MLIENGKIRRDRLKHELITESELQAAARRQGFASLEAVDRATLEPGGTISFCGRTPLPEEARHGELLTRLDHLLNEIRTLATSQQPRTNRNRRDPAYIRKINEPRINANQPSLAPRRTTKYANDTKTAVHNGIRINRQFPFVLFVYFRGSLRFECSSAALRSFAAIVCFSVASVPQW